VIASPLEISNPLIADGSQPALEDWPVSRLVHYSIALPLEFVLPHRHHDGFSIAADSG
jgi:hypothetical protein